MSITSNDNYSFWDIDDVLADSSQKERCRMFFMNIKKLYIFGTYCTEQLMIKLFGEEEGRELWHCFVVDCERDVMKWYLEYMNSEQLYVLSANILSKEDKMKVAAYLI